VTVTRDTSTHIYTNTKMHTNAHTNGNADRDTRWAGPGAVIGSSSLLAFLLQCDRHIR